MSNLRYATILIAAATLAGCIPQRERLAVRQATTCTVSVYNSPQAAPLRAKEPLRASEATLAQLSDPSFATDQERAAITEVHSQTRPCANYLVARTQQLMPAFAPILSRNFAAAEDDTIALKRRQITWGEFNKRRRDRSLAMQEEILAEQGRINANNQARMEANRAEAEREALVNALTAPRPFPVAAAPSPTMMTCEPNGAGFDCMSP